jgi:anaerobic dimethyl sulfoxide reductase subunit A
MGSATLYEAPRAPSKPGETVVTSTCGHNCGGRCVVNAHVVDGRIAKISTDARRWNPDHPPLPACARGVGQIERVYHPDRLKYPMRRTGPRGSGQYERITWEEALDEVAAQLLRVRAEYGNAAILDGSRSGSTSILHSRAPAKRFMYQFGGCTDLWSNMSCEAEIFAIRTTFGHETGHKAAGREPYDYVNSKLIVMWGWSPGDGTISQGREKAGRPHRLCRPAPPPHQPAAGGRACLHPAVNRCGGVDRHDPGDRCRGIARPGLSGSLCPGF